MDFDKLPPSVQYVAGVIVLAVSALATILALLRPKLASWFSKGADSGDEVRRLQKELDHAHLQQLLQEQRSALWASIQEAEKTRHDEFRALEREVAELRLTTIQQEARIAVLESQRRR